MRPSFPSSGYAIVSLQLKAETIDALLAEAKSSSYTRVFREVGGESDDPFRSQYRVVRMISTLRITEQAIQEDVAVRHSIYKPCVFSYMHSRPGGAYQEPHQNYTAEVRARVASKLRGAVPASVITALEEGTTIRVLEGCFEYAKPQKEIYINISRGYAVVIRGDLFHS